MKHETEEYGINQQLNMSLWINGVGVQMKGIWHELESSWVGPELTLGKKLGSEEETGKRY